MKIALVSRYYNKYQGIPHDVAELVERFVKDHEVHVFSQTFEDTDNQNIIFHKVPAVAPKSFINEFFFFFIAGIMLRKYNFDIINFHDPCWYPGGIFTCHAFPMAGINIIKKYNKSVNTGINSLLFLPFKLFYPISNYNMISKKTKKIISVSSFIKKEIISLLKRKEKDIEIIANGIDLKKFNPEINEKFKDDILKKHNLLPDDFILLFVGYYHLRKGLQFLIKAMSHIKNNKVKLLIVGDDTFGKDYIYSLIDKYNVRNKIIFAGNQNNVYKYFSVGKALVLPTLYEPFGNVVLEAMACGIPPVVSKLAGISDLITEFENGMLIEDPTNSREISDKIKCLINDKELYYKISTNTENTAKKYTWDIIADKTLNLFNRCLAENSTIPLSGAIENKEYKKLINEKI